MKTPQSPSPSPLAAMLLGAGLTLAGLWLWRVWPLTEFWQQLHHAGQQGQWTQVDWWGTTNHTQQIAVGKAALTGQTQLVAAKIDRPEQIIHTAERQVFKGLSSSAHVKIQYNAQYLFGFDLSADAFDIRADAQGLVVQVKPIKVLAKPAVTELQHQVLSGGWLINENAEIIALHEMAAVKAEQHAQTLLTDPAVLALCEKQLLMFLHDLLSKANPNARLPAIRIEQR